MKKKITFKSIAIQISLIFWAVIIIFPLLWIFVTSLKTNKEILTMPWNMPESFQFVNYVNAWQSANISQYFINSIFVTGLSIVLILALTSSSSYVIARFKYKVLSVLETIYVSCIFVPAMFSIIPSFLLAKNLGILNSRLGLVIFYSMIAFAPGIMILVGFYKTLPTELSEAAKIDGANQFTIYAKIMSPLAKSGLVAVATLNFLSIWNEYIYALIFVTDPKKLTIPVGLVNLMEVSRYRTDWGALFAGLIIAMIPTFIMYCVGQKQIVSGLTQGAVKG